MNFHSEHKTKPGEAAARVDAIGKYIARTVGPDAEWVIADIFLAYTTEPYPSGATQYTDPRYFLERRVVPYTTAEGSLISELALDKVWAEEHRTVTGTNLAEISRNTHSLPAGVPVIVYGVIVYNTKPAYLYFFSEAPPSYSWGVATDSYEWDDADNTVTVTPCAGQTDATPTGAANVAVTIVHSVHGSAKRPLPPVRVEVGDIIPFTYISATTGFAGPIGCEITSTVAVGSASTSNESALTDGEEQLYKKRLTIVQQTRTAYNEAGDEILYAFFRTFTYDCGILVSVSDETRATVATPVECP